MKISNLLKSPCVRILFFVYEEGEVRYSDFTEILASRGTLSENLKDLGEENLIQRRVVKSKPIKSFYSLTEKGEETAELLKEIDKTLAESGYKI